MAMTIVNVAVDFIASQVGRATFPAFSKLQNDTGRISNAYLRTIGYSAYFSLPIIFGIFAVAPGAIISVYGAKWAGAIPLTRILCLFGLMRSLARLTGSIFTAVGRPDITLRITLVRLGLFAVLLFALGSVWRTTGVAWAASLSMLFSGAWSIWLTNRHLDIRGSRFLSAIQPQIAAGAVMCGIVSLADRLLPSSLLNLALLVALGVAIYTGLLLILARQALQRDIREIVQLVRERLDGRNQSLNLGGGSS